MRLLTLGLVVLAIGAAGNGLITAQEAPEVFTRQPVAWEERLFEEFPVFAAMDPRPKWVFDQLQPAAGPKYGKRWFKEMRECLVEEGYELRDHLDYEDLKFYLFREGWSFRDHGGTQLRGVWYPGVLLLEIATGKTELTIRHEMVHELIGLTRHPMTASVVGRCQPGLMLDGEHARAKRTRRAFPFGRFGFPLERVGPRPGFRDELMGGTGVQLGPLGYPRGAVVLPEVYHP